MAADIRIAEEPVTSPTAQHCLERYYSELRKRFEEGFDPGKSILHTLDEFAPPNGCFLVIYADGAPVACGGFTPLGADAAYLKRMWVAPEARGLGVGRKLLSALEEKAQSLGYRFARLETHKALAEAQRLYRSSGYTEVEPFNDELYAHHWFEKALNRA
ncbi:GNAT family N-acetyltransferase [Sphingomonas sp. URHD0057]|uniref:GNAT family N-acetyltransferase n=1 Tax=Sphingomonas sp. URHD0057 TaxID=1380389 RepID=UPI000686C520|nr:GNAT family N-acetyltransferase [Sphingomonas sp. URHD0057]